MISAVETLPVLNPAFWASSRIVGYFVTAGPVPATDEMRPLLVLCPVAQPVPDAAEGVAALNAAVERVARRDPAQYQWTYKRWSIPAPGSTRGNPYWPDCYPQAARRTPSSDPGTP